ncbi:MAG: GNAT family N-acetyltransferase [Oscillospiraceae bacterium]
MHSCEIVKIRRHPELMRPAANWFHEKWHIPLAAYLESMEACQRNESAVPQWYVAMDGEAIIGGLGVIENDFHDRKDLTPNVCAVYVEEAYRRQGLAGRLLRCVCRDMEEMGIGTLYLLTDHSAFYERYGWEFLCMAQGDGEPQPSRMYVHRVV